MTVDSGVEAAGGGTARGGESGDSGTAAFLRAPGGAPPSPASRFAPRRGDRQPSSRMTIPATMSRIPAISRGVERSRKKKYEAMKVKTSST